MDYLLKYLNHLCLWGTLGFHEQEGPENARTGASADPQYGHITRPIIFVSRHLASRIHPRVLPNCHGPSMPDGLPGLPIQHCTAVVIQHWVAGWLGGRVRASALQGESPSPLRLSNLDPCPSQLADAC